MTVNKRAPVPCAWKWWILWSSSRMPCCGRWVVSYRVVRYSKLLLLLLLLSLLCGCQHLPGTSQPLHPYSLLTSKTPSGSNRRNSASKASATSSYQMLETSNSDTQITMGFAVRIRSAGQKYGPTCHQRAVLTSQSLSPWCDCRRLGSTLVSWCWQDINVGNPLWRRALLYTQQALLMPT